MAQEVEAGQEDGAEAEEEVLDPPAVEAPGDAQRGLEPGQDPDGRQELEDDPVPTDRLQQRRVEGAGDVANLKGRQGRHCRRAPQGQGGPGREPEPPWEREPRPLGVGEARHEEPPGDEEEETGDLPRPEPEQPVLGRLRPGEEHERDQRVGREGDHPQRKAPVKAPARTASERHRRQRQAAQDGQNGGDRLKRAHAIFSSPPSRATGRAGRACCIPPPRRRRTPIPRSGRSVRAQTPLPIQLWIVPLAASGPT